MHKITLFDTEFAKSANLREKAGQALPFLIKNERLVVLSEHDQTTLKNTRMIVRTPVSNIFQSILDANKLNRFLLMDLSEFAENIPEVLVYHDVTVNGSQVPGASHDPITRLWVNITPYLGRRRADRTLNINDYPAIAALIVRAALCSSYDRSEEWLTPRLSSFLLESYSMTIATLLRRIYNLSPAEYMMAQTLFAYMYAERFAAYPEGLPMPPLLSKCTFLGTSAEIGDRVRMINEVKPPGPLTLRDACALLGDLGIARMKSEFGTAAFFRMFAVGATDVHLMLIAAEYPPYWCYQLLRVASGTKNPVLSNIMRLSIMKRKLVEFATEMVKTTSLISTV